MFSTFDIKPNLDAKVMKNIVVPKCTHKIVIHKQIGGRCDLGIRFCRETQKMPYLFPHLVNASPNIQKIDLIFISILIMIVLHPVLTYFWSNLNLYFHKSFDRVTLVYGCLDGTLKRIKGTCRGLLLLT